jgi:hypothetical protein
LIFTIIRLPADGLALGLADGETDGDALALVDAEGLALGLIEADGLALGLTEGDAEGLTLSDALGDIDAD